MFMCNLILLVVSSLGRGEPQSASSKPLVPPSIGVVYLLDSSNQNLKALSDEAWKAGRSSAWKAAYGRSHTGTISLDVSGGRSSFRIATDKPEFVFTFGSPENAALYVATEDKKNKRQFAVETVNVNTNRISNLPGISVEITQFGESSYKLAPKSPLHPGEYAILLRGSPQAKDKKIFTFGIDQ
jgi:hypothetical protein